MRCEDCQNLIEEYFDAELGAAQSREVEDHLASCQTCAVAHQALAREQEMYAHYRRDIDVSPALWQAIEAGIKQQPATRPAGRAVTAAVAEGFAGRLRRLLSESFAAPRFSPALAALLVVVAVGATVAVMKFMESPSPGKIVAVNPDESKVPDKAPAGSEKNPPAPPVAGQTPTPVTPVRKENDVAPQPVKNSAEPARPRTPVVKEQLVASSTVAAEKLLQDAERKYLAAISILQRNFNKRRSQLDPGLVAKLDSALASIDGTIAETKKAMRQNPSDPIALQYMLAAYAKKVEVLRDVTAN